MESFLWFGLLLFVVMPLFFWFRVNYLKKRRDTVKSVCPHCQSVQRLERVMNYTCENCKGKVEYLDESGEKLLNAETYVCDACGTTNLVGIITCTGCIKRFGQPF